MTNNRSLNMDDFNKYAQLARDTVSLSLKQLLTQIERHIPAHVQESIRNYAQELSATSTEQLVRDVSEFRITAATGTLAVTAVTLALLLVASRGSDTQSSKSKKKKKKSKASKAQKLNKEIQAILDFVEETYVGPIDEYIENYNSLSEQDKEYKFTYFQEMLLKELIKLDNLDVAGNEILRENRRKVIRFVQEHQNRLDKFRKDNME